MKETESDDTVKLARMDRLVNRARGAMNLLLITSAVVLWGSWDTGPTKFASFYYGSLIGLLEETADFKTEKDFSGLILPEARKAANKVLEAADVAYKKAKNTGDNERAKKLREAHIQLTRSSNRMDESLAQQITVSAFESQPLKIFNFHVPPAHAGGLLSLASTVLLLYLICLARTMRRHPITGSDWIFHLDGRLPVVLGGCWLLLPAVAVTMATGQLLWELLVSGILLMDTSQIFLLMQLMVGILAPLLLGGLAIWFAWKTR